MKICNTMDARNTHTYTQLTRLLLPHTCKLGNKLHHQSQGKNTRRELFIKQKKTPYVTMTIERAWRAWGRGWGFIFIPRFGCARRPGHISIHPPPSLPSSIMIQPGGDMRRFVLTSKWEMGNLWGV